MKCHRGACSREHDFCIHRQNGDAYCEACAARINRANIDCEPDSPFAEVGLIHIPRRRGTAVGRMNEGAVLLGTSLRLRKNQLVELTPASNQPGYRRLKVTSVDGGTFNVEKPQSPQFEILKFFAVPIDGHWDDGLWAGEKRSWEDSILVEAGDVTIITPTDVLIP